MASIDQPKQEEMAKQGHGRSNVDDGLAEEGEDNKEDDGAGIQAQQVDLVVRDYGVEERRERGDQAREESVKIEGDLGGSHIIHKPRRGPGGRRLPLVEIGCKSRADLFQPLPI